MLNLHKAKTYVSPLVDLILCSAGSLCIGTGAFYLIAGKIELATTGLGSGLLLLFSATIDRFESLKGLGLEAKTRELNETITEANETLIQLRQLAEISGKTLSSLVAKVGRGGSAFTVQESYELAQEIRKNMTGMKSDESSIERALQPWVQGLCSELAIRLSMDFNNDYHTVGQSILNQLQSMPYNPDAPDPHREALQELHQSIEMHTMGNYAPEKWPAKDVLADLRKHVTTAPNVSEELKAKHLALIDSWAEEINYILKHSDLKSLQRWAEKIKR